MTVELYPWERPVGDPLHQDRDIEKHPYDRQEQRVAKYLFDLGAGGGDDPVGFLIVSRAWETAEAKLSREALRAARDLIKGRMGALIAMDVAITELDLEMLL